MLRRINCPPVAAASSSSASLLCRSSKAAVCHRTITNAYSISTAYALSSRRFASSGPSIEDAATLAEIRAVGEGAMQHVAAGASATATSTAGASFSAVPPAPLEMPMLVRGVDTALNAIYGAISWMIPDVSPLIDLGVAALIALQATLGISWATVLFGFGVAVRLSTLYFTLYGERASLRMQVALPELRQAYTRFELTYYDPSATTKEVMAVSAKLREQQAEVYSKYGTSNKKASAALLGAPVFAFGFWVAMRTTGTAQGIHATSFAWLPSLAVPDPFMILPCTVVGLTVINYELLFRKKGGAAGTGISSSVVLGVRMVAASCLWVISNFRSGVLLYWAGVSLTGLLQPLLMQSAWFHRAFKVPTQKDLDAAVEQAKVIAERANAATVGGKTPTQAFMDKLREQRTSAQSRVSVPAATAAKKTDDAAASDTAAKSKSSSSSSSSSLFGFATPIPEPKSTSPLTYKVTSATTGATISTGAAAAAAAPAAAPAAAAQKPKHAASYFAPKPGGVAYRILHESDVEKRQKEEAAASEADPLMQRFMFAMPSLSQGVANPQKQQQLAEEIQQHNEKQMEEAKKAEDAMKGGRSWKGKND